MIHVENLTKYYADVCAVDHISFDIHRGEILGLLGPNGAGKTTTLRMLTGYLQPTTGNIQVKNYAISEDILNIKKLLGYLPESAPLYHDMIVYEYLDYIAEIREINGSGKIKRIRELAELCGLNAVMHKPIGELSKGFKQRVGLAHAMMSDPEILVLDEPTSGLDPNQIIEIREIIRRIGKEKTIILSTHILSEVEATCDRVVIINQGKIIADGDMESIKKAGAGRKCIRISLMDTNTDAVEAVLGSMEGIEEMTLATEPGQILRVKIEYRSSLDLRKDLYHKIKETDWVLLEFYQETETLENIFRELTREK